MPKIDCPVCNEPAAAVAAEIGFRYSCSQCGEFAVSDASSMSISRYGGRQRAGLLLAAIARAKPGQVPVISHTD